MAFTHLHVHSEHSPLDGMIRIQDGFEHVAGMGQDALAITDHGGLSGAWAAQNAADRAGVKFIAGCLRAGQEILTNVGVKAVEDITVGDQVLTHRGRYRPVLSVMAPRVHRGRAYEVRLAGRYTRPLTLTDEHPILVRHHNGHREWLKPGEIVAGRRGSHRGISDWNSYVCVPKPDVRDTPLDVLALVPTSERWGVSDGSVSKQSSIRDRRVTWTGFPKLLPLSEELGYFLGLYAAEGTLGVHADDRLTGRISFHLNVAEIAYAERVISFARSLGGRGRAVQRHDRRSSLTVEVSCLPLAHIVDALVGRHSWKKRVPEHVLVGPETVRRGFIEGLVDGDGRSSSSSIPRQRGNLRVVSRDLAWGFRTLIAGFGFFVGVHKSERSDEGTIAGNKSPTLTRRPVYTVAYSPDRTYPRSLEDDKHVYRPISEINAIELDETVYNFEVAEDNSYVSDFVLHNCEAYVAIGSRHERNAHWVDADDNSTDEDSERSDDKADATITDGLKKSRYFHLTLLARTPEGWTNLVRLNNAAQESVWSKPRIDFDLLAEHAEGLIVLTGCVGGPVLGPLSRRARVLERAERLQSVADRAVQLHREALAKTVVPYAPDLTTVAAALEESGCADVHEAVAAAASIWAEADSARTYLRTLIGAVGSDNVYVELMEHGIPAESAILADAVALAREEGVGIVATNDAHHLTADDAQAHAAWLLVQSKSTLENPKYRFHGSGFHLRSETEMRALRPESWWQEACDTTNTIADRCAERTLPTWRNLIPRFPTPDGFTTNREYLFHLLRAGAAGRYGGIDQATRDRVLTETGVVEQAGMVDYFLIVHDLVTWARSDAPARPGGPVKEPISVGPGRGSAGGSEIAYLLGITQIEPRRYGLLFERFYEAGRSEPPDIDLDFPESRRDEVIQYLRERWGHGNVAFLGTFTMSRMKRAIDDAARVLDQAPLGARMKKLVPNAEAKPMPAAQLMDPAVTAAAEYRHLVESDPAAQRIHELASSFEDVVAGFGMHASGIIVSSQPLGDLVPLRKDSRGWVMQWSGLDAEQFGLLKVDVLGLRTLDVIDQAVKYIAQTTGEQLDWTKIPDPDVPHTGRDAERVDAAWRVIADGRTAGLFQLDSPPMTELAMRVRARSLAEHSATIALYRPGPMGMGMHDTYARRKRGEEQISYRDFTSDPKEQELIASVLAETFGVIVFQEQIMRIGSVVAGFDATGRSKLRKATSKKKKDVMAAVGEQFMASGVIATTDSATSVQSAPFRPETVQALWDTMVSFAEYAFNASHSTAYGLLSYVTAFLKGTWPAEFAAAMLATTTSTSKDEKRIMVLRALQREGVTVLPPDVNLSQARTAPEGSMAIRFGLSEIKGLGKPGALIAQARDLHGPFSSLHDIVRLVNADRSDGEKTTKAVVTQSALRTLIDSGAADAFGSRLGLTAVSAALAAGPVPVPPMEWGVLERATRQRDRLLVSLGDSPMTLLSDQLDQVTVPAADPRFDAKPVRVEEIPNTSVRSWTSSRSSGPGPRRTTREDGWRTSVSTA